METYLFVMGVALAALVAVFVARRASSKAKHRRDGSGWAPGTTFGSSDGGYWGSGDSGSWGDSGGGGGGGDGGGGGGGGN